MSGVAPGRAASLPPRAVSRRGGGRSVELEAGPSVGGVFDVDVLAEELVVEESGDFGEVVAVGFEPGVFVAVVDGQVGDDASLVAEEEGSSGVAAGHLRDVLGDESVEEGFDLRAGHAEASALGDGHDADEASDGGVFGFVSSESGGHFDAAVVGGRSEGHEASVGLGHEIVKVAHGGAPGAVRRRCGGGAAGWFGGVRWGAVRFTFAGLGVAVKPSGAVAASRRRRRARWWASRGCGGWGVGRQVGVGLCRWCGL